MSQNHYNSIAQDFEQNWFFGQSYFDDLVRHLINNLSLFDKADFLDIGCGTGHFTNQIIKGSRAASVGVTGVDFSENMISKFKLHDCDYNGVVADVESFVKNSTALYDRVLLKEVIHHVADFNSFFSHLKLRLKPDGRALIVTRPQSVEFPFFDLALQNFHDGQVSQFVLEDAIASAGLNLKTEVISLPISIPKEKLFDMIGNRFMSTFYEFSDGELKDGLSELELKFRDTDVISFKDNLLFITIT